MSKVPSIADLRAMSRANTVPCECCAATGRRPLRRTEMDTLAALTGEWQTTGEIKAKVRGRVGIGALSYRLGVLAGHGLAESSRLVDVRPFTKPGDGGAKLWRIVAGKEG